MTCTSNGHLHLPRKRRREKKNRIKINTNYIWPVISVRFQTLELFLCVNGILCLRLQRTLKTSQLSWEPMQAHKRTHARTLAHNDTHTELGRNLWPEASSTKAMDAPPACSNGGGVWDMGVWLGGWVTMNHTEKSSILKEHSISSSTNRVGWSAQRISRITNPITKTIKKLWSWQTPYTSGSQRPSRGPTVYAGPCPNHTRTHRILTSC